MMGVSGRRYAIDVCLTMGGSLLLHTIYEDCPSNFPHRRSNDSTVQAHNTESYVET